MKTSLWNVLHDAKLLKSLWRESDQRLSLFFASSHLIGFYGWPDETLLQVELVGSEPMLTVVVDGAETITLEGGSVAEFFTPQCAMGVLEGAVDDVELVLEGEEIEGRDWTIDGPGIILRARFRSIHFQLPEGQVSISEFIAAGTAYWAAFKKRTREARH